MKMAIDRAGRNPFELTQRYVDINNPKTIKTPSFASFVSKVLPYDKYQELVNDKSMNLLVHYLSKDEPRLISVEKLNVALKRTDEQLPLPQDNLEEIDKYISKIQEDFQETTKGEIHPIVAHLIYFMRREKLSIQYIFDQKHATQITPQMTIAKEDFLTMLKDQTYESENPDMLVSLLKPDGNKGKHGAFSVSLFKLDKANRDLKLMEQK